MSEGNGVCRDTPGTDRRKTVVLVMPGYGNLTGGAARGFHQASREFDVELGYAGGSLLALNMNILWCAALNRARAGLPIDYFAMQHSDVEPEDHWLDVMVPEMEARGLDVLAAAIPLKDPRGLTSTALARDDGDTWQIKCRLTMTEVHRLPETFTSEDVGAPLLVNTGLWVCRFREEWARRVYFRVNDRIALDPRSGKYFPQNEPEDWFISRLFYEQGLRVGCTRKVDLAHRGAIGFRNANPWGSQSFDRDAISESVVPGSRSGWFPADVEGWLTEAEGSELSVLAEGKRVLEIGSYCGRSTVCLARGAASVVCVDPFDGRATPSPGSTHERFLANLDRYGVRGKVSVRVGTAADYAGSWPDGSFDVAFVDGAHDYESVKFDAALAARLVGPGGVVAFHDYRKFPGEADGRWDPGVTRAVDELLSGGAELLGRTDSLAVVRPRAAVLVGV